MQDKQTRKTNTRNTWISLIGATMAVVFLIALGMIVYGIYLRIVDSNIASMEETALHDEVMIRNTLYDRWDELKTISEEIRENGCRNEEELLSQLPSLVKYVEDAEYIMLLDSEGTEYRSTGLVKKNAELASYVRERKDCFVTRYNRITRMKGMNRNVFYMGIPVQLSSAGKQFEWLLCRLDISMFENELTVNTYSGEGYSVVIDEEGNYIVYTSVGHSMGVYDNLYEELKNAKFDGLSGTEELRSVIRNTVKGSISMQFTDGESRQLMVVTPLKYADWYLITRVPTAAFGAQTGAILKYVFILLGILILIVVVIVILLLRSRKQRNELEIAEATNQAKTQFLFNMSHDIRTPMNAILGYTDIGLRHVENVGKSTDSYKKIQSAGRHLLSLINDILEMSRIEAGKLVLTESPLYIHQAVSDVSHMSQALAVPKSINFETVTGEITDPYILADELHINEVLINLISNAIKYTPDGGNVRFSVSQISAAENGFAEFRFEVSDNGIGMSEEFQKHLFETFSREENAEVSKTEGAGLGLSIVKRIVDMTGGTIRVDSIQGEGSTFTLEIPFRLMDADAIEEFKKFNRPRSFEKSKGLEEKRVLLVEDNEMNREIATEILTEAGLHVETAVDGEMALKFILDNGIDSVDFILMDIQMPVMNGYEATKAIRLLPDGNRIPIIALSANAFEEDRQKSLSCGMDAHIAKPININELLDTMNNFL